MIDTTPTESRLRDELSKRLELLEPGLVLRSVEYRLPNRQGASGRIDILAVDSYSANVIIEIKKSNQTAHQALHELHKYIALMKDANGLRDSHLRCIVVSTEWHELLVPFSEFFRSAPWVVDGYQLYLTDAGLPDRCEKVVPVSTPIEMRLCPEHKMYLFRDRARRDEALPILLKSSSASYLFEYLILKLDIKTRRTVGACDFALYLIVTEFTPDERQRARDRLAQTDWARDLDEPIRYLEEQLTLAEMAFDLCDEHEIGYPEKLKTICVTWDVCVLIRGGPRLESQAIFSDDNLLRWAKGLEGRNAFHFEMIGTPRRRLPWTEAKESVEYCLNGNEAWRTLVHAYLEDIERNHPDTTVTAKIYNPCNLMMGLYRLAKLNAGDMLPSVEIAVSSNDGRPLRIVFGSMIWNGKCVSDVADVLPDYVSTLFDLFAASVLDGGPRNAEEHLIAQHGLSYVLVEWTTSSDGIILKQLVIEGGTLRRCQFNEQELEAFGAFYIAHQDYLRALVDDFDSWACFG